MPGCCTFGSGGGMNGTLCDACADRLEDFRRWLRMAMAGRLAAFTPRVPPVPVRPEIPRKGGG